MSFDGWRDYEDFANEVQRRNRFVPSERMERFLAEVRATSPRRSGTVSRGTEVYRAQVGCDWRTSPWGEGGAGFFVSSPEPFSAERMVPSAEHVSQGGRGNPPGIAYLYLSNLGATAIAEVRPWAGACVTVARFKVQRDIRVLDLTLFPPPQDHISAGTPTPDEVEQLVWSAINRAYAAPVDPNAQMDYLPTQYLAEVFREQGFDGLLYGSALGEPGSKNYMLFSLEDALIEERFVAKVERATYRYDVLEHTARPHG